MNSLFRKEVFDSKRYGNLGDVFINTPMRYQLISSGFIVLAIILILYLCFGEYSEKYLVSGSINSLKGIVRVFPSKSGIIAKSNSVQGKAVKKGELLFVIDTSYDGLSEKKGILSKLKKRKESYKNEISYKENQIISLKKLVEKKYISLDLYNQKHEELVSLKNNKNLVEMELIKYKQSRSYTIRSPIDGTIATVIYKRGQTVNLSKPLIKILPANSELQAELFIPVRKSGFLRKNTSLIIRYDAYPYERFGSYKAKIKEISQSILTDEEEEKAIKVREPYYKVIAPLESQTVKIYGKEVKIQEGMTITGIIEGSKRKIWQRILDPIYSFYGATA